MKNVPEPLPDPLHGTPGTKVRDPVSGRLVPRKEWHTARREGRPVNLVPTLEEQDALARAAHEAEQPARQALLDAQQKVRDDAYATERAREQKLADEAAEQTAEYNRLAVEKFAQQQINKEIRNNPATALGLPSEFVQTDAPDESDQE